MHFSKLDIIVSPDDDCSFLDFGFDVYLVMARHTLDMGILSAPTGPYQSSLKVHFIKKKPFTCSSSTPSYEFT